MLLFIKDFPVGVMYLRDASGTRCNNVEIKITREAWCHVGKFGRSTF